MLRSNDKRCARPALAGLAFLCAWILVSAGCASQPVDELVSLAEPADRNQIECRYIKLPGSAIKRMVCREQWQWEEEMRRGRALVEKIDTAYKLRDIPTGAQLY